MELPLYIPETYGSSAYAPIYDEPRTNSTREVKKTEKKRTVTRRAKKFAAIGVLWMCAMLLLVRYAVITEQCRQVELLTNQLSETKAEVVQAQLDLNKEINLSYIEEYASTELGMVRPATSQEVYITIRQGDQSEVLNTNENTGFFAAIGNRIMNALEYLN